MGKIKSKLARRTSKVMLDRGVDFTEDFEKNKRVLGNTMPSKKIRNQIAGLLSRTKKQQRVAEEKLMKK
jgi:ribosomal protein S17E